MATDMTERMISTWQEAWSTHDKKHAQRLMTLFTFFLAFSLLFYSYYSRSSMLYSNCSRL